jgi:hypothetical protein
MNGILGFFRSQKIRGHPSPDRNTNDQEKRRTTRESDMLLPLGNLVEFLIARRPLRGAVTRRRVVILIVTQRQRVVIAVLQGVIIDI